MRINQPILYNLPSHYRGDGLIPFQIKLRYKSGTPIDLTDAKIKMQLRAVFCAGVAFEFSSEGDGDALITISDASNGIIQFPEIKSWVINSAKYDYDLQVTDQDGIVKTYMRGTWGVNQDITKEH